MGARNGRPSSFDHDEALRLAVRYGDLASAQMAISRGANPDCRDQAGAAPLHTAALLGNVGLVRMLLAQKASVDLQNRDGRTSLHCATHAGHEKAVLALIEGGAHVEARDDWGDSWTPLHYAGRGGFSSIVAILLESSAYINSTTTCTACTALHEAARTGSLATIRKLLIEGADPSLCNRAGETFLQCAPAELLPDIQRDLHYAQNLTEVMKRRQGLLKRQVSSLKIRNTAKRLSSQQNGRACGFIVSLWAPPQFLRKNEREILHDAQQPTLTDDDLVLHRSQAEAEQTEGASQILQDIDFHFMQDPRLPTAHEKSQQFDIPACSSMATAEVIFIMEDAVVAKKYTRSSTQLTQLIQDCSVIFAIDATEIILRSRYGELRSDSDLQKLLETTDVIELYVRSMVSYSSVKKDRNCRCD